jgi:hypothetical protein
LRKEIEPLYRLEYARLAIGYLQRQIAAGFPDSPAYHGKNAESRRHKEIINTRSMATDALSMQVQRNGTWIKKLAGLVADLGDEMMRMAYDLGGTTVNAEAASLKIRRNASYFGLAADASSGLKTLLDAADDFAIAGTTVMDLVDFTFDLVGLVPVVGAEAEAGEEAVSDGVDFFRHGIETGKKTLDLASKAFRKLDDAMRKVKQFRATYALIGHSLAAIEKDEAQLYDQIKTSAAIGHELAGELAEIHLEGAQQATEEGFRSGPSVTINCAAGTRVPGFAQGIVDEYIGAGFGLTDVEIIFTFPKREGTMRLISFSVRSSNSLGDYISSGGRAGHLSGSWNLAFASASSRVETDRFRPVTTTTVLHESCNLDAKHVYSLGRAWIEAIDALKPECDVLWSPPLKVALDFYHSMKLGIGLMPIISGNAGGFVGVSIDSGELRRRYLTHVFRGDWKQGSPFEKHGVFGTHQYTPGSIAPSVWIDGAEPEVSIVRDGPLANTDQAPLGTTFSGVYSFAASQSASKQALLVSLGNNVGKLTARRLNFTGGLS